MAQTETHTGSEGATATLPVAVPSPPPVAYQGVTIRREKRLALYARDEYTCVWCGKVFSGPLGLSLDHLHQNSKGGDQSGANLVSACFECNCKRGSKGVRKFRTWLREVEKITEAQDKGIDTRLRRARRRDFRRYYQGRKVVRRAK